MVPRVDFVSAPGTSPARVYRPGGPYALAAARGLQAHGSLTPRQIAEQAMEIASGVCENADGTDTAVGQDLNLQQDELFFAFPAR